MEIVQEFSSQYFLYIPIAFVIVGAILVFTFGFKSAEQPSFDKLSLDDRKSAGKKRRTKEKKPTANGHITSGDQKSDKSPSKESKKSPQKEPEKKEKKLEKQNEKPKKHEIKKNEDIKNKKNSNKIAEKPVDFDDGNWETVPLKADKKKKEQSPAKKEKKVAKKEKESKVEKAEIEKLVKDAINKELKEKEKEKQAIIAEEKTEEPIKIEVIIAVDEKKDKKKKEKKLKKEIVEKPVQEEIKIQQEEVKKEVKDVAPPKPIIPEKIEEPISANPQEAAPVFDELGDTWTESKATKKTSKKKARRDN